MVPQVLMGLIEEAMDCGVFECTVYPLNQPICPGMVWFSETMVNAMLFTDAVK